MDNYQNFDDDGQPYGFAIDYLDRIAQETGWKYEYVELETWRQGEEMLQNGELDLLSSAEITQERTENYLFSACSLGGSYVDVVTDDNTIEFEDYDAMKTMRVGTESGISLSERYKNWADVRGLPGDIVEYGSYAEVCQALENGEVDAMLRSTYSDSCTLNTIARISYAESYFMLNKNAVDLKNELDEAMTATLIAEPELRTELILKYFPEMTDDPITYAEQEQIESFGTIRIAVPTDRWPMIYLDEATGEVVGIAIELLDKVEELTGLTFEYVPYANGEETAAALLNGECQLKIPAGASGNAAYGLNSMVVSSTLMSFALSVVSVGGWDPTLSDTWTVGVTAESVGMGDTICQNYDNCVVMEYNDWDDACQALLDGKVDTVAVNNAAASYLLQKPAYSSIRLVSSVAIATPVSVGGFSEYSWIISVINKGIKLLEEGDIQNTFMKYTSLRDYDYTFSDYLYIYRLAIVTILAVALTVALGFAIYLRKRKKYETELVSVNRDLVNASEAKSNFLSRMSHDIRTPINGIMGMTMLAQDNENPEDTQQCLEKIQTSCDFLLGLVNDTLDITKVESGKIELHPEAYSISEFEKYLNCIIEPMCRQKNIDFVCNTGNFEDTAPLMLDKLRTNQIMFNLLSNAVKFTPEGGRVSMKVWKEQLGEHRVRVYAEVSDNGIGMSRDFQKHMFESFTQEEQTVYPQHQGTGLGLAIVKTLVQLMNGDISAESELGKGTTFRFYLESEPAAVTALSDPANEKPAENEACLAGRHILLAEDHPLNREIAVRLLEKEGAVVVTAEDGKEAVEVFATCASGYFDAILTDIRMPVMDGLEAAKKIRTLKRDDAKSVPIIAMTANAYAEDMEKAKEVGMDAYLAKPIKPELLYETLTSEIRNRIG